MLGILVSVSVSNVKGFRPNYFSSKELRQSAITTSFFFENSIMFLELSKRILHLVETNRGTFMENNKINYISMDTNGTKRGVHGLNDMHICHFL